MGWLWLAILPARPLFNPDEGRYAEIPREMLADGDWVIPHLNGLAYVEKPPLQYWATALSLRVFGDGEFGARLYTALCAFGTVSLTWVLAQGLWGGECGWRSAAVLAGMLLFVVLGQLLTLDMSLTFYMTGALTGFLLAQRPHAGRHWMRVAWLAVALGVLTKGPVAAVIPAIVLATYSLAARDFSPWRRLQPVWGLPLFLAVTVPWYWLAARRLPDFLAFFFVHEHLARYLTPSADREAPWWFFAAVFLAGTAPWTVAALRVVLLSWRQLPWRLPLPGRQFDAVSFLWLWVVLIGVFFSLSDSKLIPYLLPVLPAVAVLIGASPTAVLQRDAAVTAWFTFAAGAAAVGIGLLAARFVAVTERSQYFLPLAPPLKEIGLLLAVSGAFVLLRCRHDLTRGVLFLGLGWCLAGLLLGRAAAVVAPVYSGAALGQALELERVPPGVPIFSVATYDQSVPFYAQRTVTLVAYRGELDFGLQHRPGAALAQVGDFEARWRGLADGYAVMEIPLFDELVRRGVPMRGIARDLHRVLVARR